MIEREPAAPKSLRETQTFLVDVMQSPQPLAAREDVAEPLRAVAAGSAKLTPVGQVDVYREQFWLRHVFAVGEDFPTLKHLLGDAGFKTMLERYIGACPPADFLLRDASAKLADFLLADARYANDPLLEECARVEWAFIDVMDAENPRPFDATSLAGASEEALLGARLEMQAALRLYSFTHAVHEFREAVRTGKSPARPEPCATHLAIFRAGDELRYFALDPAAFAVVSALLEGAPLAEACGRAVAAGADEAEIGAKLGQWFQWWTQWGWLERVVLA